MSYTAKQAKSQTNQINILKGSKYDLQLNKIYVIDADIRRSIVEGEYYITFNTKDPDLLILNYYKALDYKVEMQEEDTSGTYRVIIKWE